MNRSAFFARAAVGRKAIARAALSRAASIFLVATFWTIVPGHSSVPDSIAIPFCPLPAGARPVSRLDFMPRSLQATIKAKIGEVVLPKAPFDATDVKVTGHDRRLIFIWARRNRWLIATEHGGLAYNEPVFAYTVSVDGETASLVEERIAFPETLCQTANQLLDGSPPQ